MLSAINIVQHLGLPPCGRLRLKCDGTRAETRFRLSAKRTSPFKSAGASVQSTTGSRGVCISGSNAGCTMFRGSVRVLAIHSIRQFPHHFPFRASSCVITFQLDITYSYTKESICPWNYSNLRPSVSNESTAAENHSASRCSVLDMSLLLWSSV